MSDRRTPLHEAHVATGARMTPFGGWSMPVQFDSITVEHEAVRSNVGKFDVSHMGEVMVEGPDAADLMQRLTTNDVERLDVGDGQYAAITDESGVMLDDTIVFRLPQTSDDPRYLFVPNAGNDATMVERWREHCEAWNLDAEVTNRTEEYAMLAVQGPDAVTLVNRVTDEEIDELRRFRMIETPIAGAEGHVSRTGYTGEDGVEILLAWDDASAVWDALDCQACGLGARDTLRLEAGLLLGGNEFDRVDNPRTPLEAGIAFAVDLDTPFVGRDALAAIAEDGPTERLVGIGMEERGIPRSGYAILDDAGDPIGTVTSGTMSPTLDRPIGLGYVHAEHASSDTPVQIRIRDTPKRAKIESLPFVG